MTDPTTGPQPGPETGPEIGPETEDRPSLLDDLHGIRSGQDADGVEAADGAGPDPSAAEQTPPVPPPPDPAAPPGRRRVRVGTVVLGLVLAVVAVTVWIDGVLERHVSLGGVATVVMLGAGAMLLGGAVLRQAPRST